MKSELVYRCWIYPLFVESEWIRVWLVFFFFSPISSSEIARFDLSFSSSSSSWVTVPLPDQTSQDLATSMISSKVTTPLPNRLLRFSLLSWSLPYVTDPLPGQTSQGLARYFYAPSIDHGSAPGTEIAGSPYFSWKRSFQANIFCEMIIVYRFRTSMCGSSCKFEMYVSSLCLFNLFPSYVWTRIWFSIPWMSSLMLFGCRSLMLEADFRMYWSLMLYRSDFFFFQIRLFFHLQFRLVEIHLVIKYSFRDVKENHFADMVRSQNMN